MTKMKDLKIAQKLAEITGRPLEDFYDGETKSNKQEKEESVEKVESVSTESTSRNVPEIRSETKTDSTETISSSNIASIHELDTFAKEWKGEIVNKVILKNERRMTRKEYLKMKRTFKTTEEFYNSPLLYLMFRSEEQADASFITWTTLIEKEINK